MKELTELPPNSHMGMLIYIGSPMEIVPDELFRNRRVFGNQAPVTDWPDAQQLQMLFDSVMDGVLDAPQEQDEENEDRCPCDLCQPESDEPDPLGPYVD